MLWLHNSISLEPCCSLGWPSRVCSSRDQPWGTSCSLLSNRFVKLSQNKMSQQKNIPTARKIFSLFGACCYFQSGSKIPVWVNRPCFRFELAWNWIFSGKYLCYWIQKVLFVFSRVSSYVFLLSCPNKQVRHNILQYVDAASLGKGQLNTVGQKHMKTI